MDETTEKLEVESVVDTKKEEKTLTTKQSIILAVSICVGVIFIAVIAILLGIREENENFVYYNVNEKFEFYNMEYTVLKYEVDDDYVNPVTYGTMYPTNDNNYLVSISLKIYNPTTSKIKLSDGLNGLYTYSLYCNDAKYYTKWGYGSAFLMNYDDIDPFETINCDLLFEVPKAAVKESTNIELRLSLNKKDTKDIFVVKLKSA